MDTDLQFSPGFLTLRDDRDVARLDDRLRADVGIVRGKGNTFEHDGKVIETPAGGMARLLDVAGRVLGTTFGRTFRHA